LLTTISALIFGCSVDQKPYRKHFTVYRLQQFLHMNLSFFRYKKRCMSRKSRFMHPVVRIFQNNNTKRFAKLQKRLRSSVLSAAPLLF